MKWYEKLAYEIVIFGVMVDQMTTRIALLYPWMIETNPNALMLMGQGLWLYMDLFLLASAIIMPAVIIRFLSFEGRRVVLLYPFLFGILRLMAGLNNVVQIWKPFLR